MSVRWKLAERTVGAGELHLDRHRVARLARARGCTRRSTARAGSIGSTAPGTYTLVARRNASPSSADARAHVRGHVGDVDPHADRVVLAPRRDRVVVVARGDGVDRERGEVGEVAPRRVQYGGAAAASTASPSTARGNCAAGRGRASAPRARRAPRRGGRASGPRAGRACRGRSARCRPRSRRGRRPPSSVIAGRRARTAARPR